MAISDRTRKILWGRAGGRCSICRKLLVTPGTETDDPSVIGQEAHIISERPNGPRHQDLADYDVYDNLILLDGDHHKRVDDQVGHYSVEELERLKREHEAWVERQGTGTDPIRIVPDPAYPIPQHLTLCRTGTELQQIIRGAHMFYPDTSPNVTEAQHDLAAGFFDTVRDCMDVASFDDSFRARREVAKVLDEQIKELNDAGLFVGARRRHCLVTGGVQDPSPWLVFDLELHSVLDGEIRDDKGQRVWPPKESAASTGDAPS